MRWAQEETETEVDASAAAADAVAGVAVAPDGFPLLAFPDDAQLTALRDQRERESREAAEAMLEQARIELLDRWQELQAEGVETVGHALSVTPVVAAGHDRLQAVMSAAPDAILSFDAAGRILTCNPATERLFDAPQAEVVGSAVDRWLPGLVLPQPVAGDSPHGEVREAVAHTAGGREFIAEVAISFVDHDGGRLGAAVLRVAHPAKVLGVAAIAVLLLLGISANTTGAVAGWTLLSVGLFNSIMFPTIFTLASEKLGARSAEGSGLICVAIVGGAIVPPLTGMLADHTSLTFALLVPALCYAGIAAFSWYARRLAPELAPSVAR